MIHCCGVNVREIDGLLCDECGSDSMEVVMGFTLDDHKLGRIHLENISCFECKDCGDVLLDADSWRAADVELAKLKS